MPIVATISTTNHIAIMANMTRTQKYQYCFEQSIGESDQVKALEWMAKARHFERQTPVEVTVSSNGFAA